MAKLVIVYDSKTGNTEKMATAINEGAQAVSGVNVMLKKIGEPFSCFGILYGADAIILGSPAHYGHVTPGMRDFLMCLLGAKESGRIELEGRIGAAFGSYAWDGGVCIERLAEEMEGLGIRVESRVLAQTPLLPHSALNENALEDCRKLGKTIAEKVSNQ
jgi:NAD(P)H dehydrogenase (quinone)